MRGSKKARAVWTVLLVLWLCFVWGHSLVPADLSSEESSRFLFLVRPIFALFGSTDEQLMTYVIRKCAHFMEYVVLTFLASGCARAWWADAPAAKRLVVVTWACVPVVDEFIQSFSPGRAPRLTDVLIDMSGGALGMCLWWLLHRRRRPRQ